jgi:isopenicillin N synthase-like dioxygenase
MNNWQDWIAGLNPTNALSVLKMPAPAPINNPPGVVVVTIGHLLKRLVNGRSNDRYVEQRSEAPITQPPH